MRESQEILNYVNHLTQENVCKVRTNVLFLYTNQKTGGEISDESRNKKL